MRSDDAVSIHSISKKTSMTVDDIVASLQHMGALHTFPDGTFAIRASHEEVSEYFRNLKAKGLAVVDPNALRWTPDPANIIKVPDS